MKHQVLRAFAALTATAALAAGLSACVPLVVGGAAVGALVAVDRRTSGAQLEDEGIELRAGSRLREALGDKARVRVTSYNRQVLLTGEVASEQTKQQAGEIVSKVDNVRAIVNELERTNSPSFTERSSDLLTTGKVRASFVDSKDLYAGAFKVVTERGVTYLMGRVTQREADLATQITRTVGGVQRVVRIFEIVSPEELQGITSQQQRAPATSPSLAPQTPASAPKSN